MNAHPSMYVRMWGEGAVLCSRRPLAGAPCSCNCLLVQYGAKIRCHVSPMPLELVERRHAPARTPLLPSRL